MNCNTGLANYVVLAAMQYLSGAVVIALMIAMLVTAMSYRQPSCGGHAMFAIYTDVKQSSLHAMVAGIGNNPHALA